MRQLLQNDPNVTGENINNDLLKFSDWRNSGSNLDPDFETKSQEVIFPIILNKLNTHKYFQSYCSYGKVCMKRI